MDEYDLEMLRWITEYLKIRNFTAFDLYAYEISHRIKENADDYNRSIDGDQIKNYEDAADFYANGIYEDAHDQLRKLMERAFEIGIALKLKIEYTPDAQVDLFPDELIEAEIEKVNHAPQATDNNVSS